MIEYLSPELLAMNMAEITPLHLSREWARLVKCGGHSRKTKAPRAMKPKTVRNIAGLVSSAFARAIKWGLVTANPVTHSDLPKVKKRIGMALLPAEQDRLIQCARGPWCLPVMLEMSTATGARRGEVLALRWSDIKGTDIFIDRSLCQTKEGLVFKGTKTDEPRKVEMPPSLMSCLEAHRLRQDEFRRQFGPTYRSDLDLIFANPDGSPADAEFGLVDCGQALPKAGPTQRRLSPRAAPQPREPPAGQRRGPRDRLRTPRPLLRAHDCRHLLARHPRQGPRSPPCVGTTLCRKPATRNPPA